MKRLKIALFLDSYYPAIDGVVIACDNLAKSLSKYNDVTVIVPYTNTYKDDIDKPYKIIRIKSYHIPLTEYRLGKISTKFSKEYKLLLKENFDIIHIHSPFTIGSLGIKLAKKLNIPCIATIHTKFDSEIKRIINNKKIINIIMKKIMNTFSKCDNCILVNDPLISEIKKYGYNGNITVIYNATDLKPNKNNIETINKLYNLNENDIVLLFVGRITSIKNIFFILESLKLLKEDNIKFKMLYVGSGPDENKLKNKINQYNLQNEVILTGRISNRDKLSLIYKRANLLLFPSLFDTSSLVRIEAAVNETPGLFIENSMVANTVKNNISGFTSPLDAVVYKDRIKEIVNNKKLLTKVAKTAQKKLYKSWHDISKDTYKLYLKEIEKKNK